MTRFGCTADDRTMSSDDDDSSSEPQAAPTPRTRTEWEKQIREQYRADGIVPLTLGMETQRALLRKLMLPALAAPAGLDFELHAIQWDQADRKNSEFTVTTRLIAHAVPLPETLVVNDEPDWPYAFAEIDFQVTSSSIRDETAMLSWDRQPFSKDGLDWPVLGRAPRTGDVLHFVTHYGAVNYFYDSQNVSASQAADRLNFKVDFVLPFAARHHTFNAVAVRFPWEELATHTAEPI